VAQILQVEHFPDGRSALAAVGTRRIRVTQWLEDDPYPRAEVEDWPDPSTATLALDEVETLFRRALALAAELGEAGAPLDVELADDPAVATFQIAALAPIGPADRQAVLATEEADERTERLTELLTDGMELLRARLGG
jgi:Lon protease-like protein